MGKIYLGIYTLRISEPLVITDCMPMVVLSEKKDQRVCPQIRYSG